MSAYIVTYDLNKEVKRPNIVGEIKKFGSWAKLSESSYAISTSLTPAQVRDSLKPLLDSNDDLYVIKLSTPWASYGSKEVNDWLNKHVS